MAEESMVSTAESGISGFDAGPAGGGAAVQAEMITKKLANYWCLIGSIPLVLFLLVALPTIYYVKTFSDYVNAYYCDTKSCKDIADAIEKAGAPADACTSFSAAACKGKADYMLQLWKNVKDEIGKISDDSPPPEAAQAGRIKAMAAACVSTALADPTDPPPLVGSLGKIGDKLNFKPDLVFDTPGHLNAYELSGWMSAYGMDGMVRAVAFLINNTDKSLELSAPIQDMYPIMVMDVLKKKFGELAKRTAPEDTEPDPTPIVDGFAAAFATHLLQSTSQLKDNIPVVVTKDELLAQDATNPKWSWTSYFTELEKGAKINFDGATLIRLSHPTYFLGLSQLLNSTEKFPGGSSMYLQLIMGLYMLGPMVMPDQIKGKEYLCNSWADRIIFGGSGQFLFTKRSAQFGAATGINPGNANTSSMALFVRTETNEMLDSMALSYSLALSSSEKGRANFHTLTRSMEIDPGAFYDNTSKAVSDAKSVLFFPTTILFGDPPDPADIMIQAKLQWAELYWKYTPENLRFRDPMSTNQIYATYSPTEEHLYVPMAVFTKPFFRNTKNNRAFAALGGYAVIASVMKALTSYGSFVRKGELYPQGWTGLSWADKMVKYQKCLTVQRAAKGQNGTLHGAMDQYMVGAVLPALRYFRRMVFRVAFPRPEFRIDWISSYSSTQIFYYTWAMMHCGTDQGKALVDLAAKNSKYFHESFECKTTLDAKRCQLWESSRRKY